MDVVAVAATLPDATAYTAVPALVTVELRVANAVPPPFNRTMGVDSPASAWRDVNPICASDAESDATATVPSLPILTSKLAAIVAVAVKLRVLFSMIVEVAMISSGCYILKSSGFSFASFKVAENSEILFCFAYSEMS